MELKIMKHNMQHFMQKMRGFMQQYSFFSSINMWTLEKHAIKLIFMICLLNFHSEPMERLETEQSSVQRENLDVTNLVWMVFDQSSSTHGAEKRRKKAWFQKK